MDVRKPVWTESSFLLYVGGLTVLGAALSALTYLSSRYGDAAYAGWTLLPLVVLAGVAQSFRHRGEWVTAGLFGFAALAMWTAFLAAVWSWWGWLPDNIRAPFDGWNWGLWFLLLLVIVIGLSNLRVFRFPLLLVFPLPAAYYLVTDVLSGGGNWSAVLTLLIGLFYLMIGRGLDGRAGHPYGFWLHVFAGLLVGGALVYWWHSSELDFALLAATGVVFVGLAARTHRSSWAVFGVGAFLASTVHWVSEWQDTGITSLPTDRDWVAPLVFGIVGFFFVFLGLAASRRRRELA